MATEKKKHKNVLVMRLSVLGNVAMAIPVLYPVCKANPDTRFIMLTKRWPASMFHDRPANLKVVDFDVKENYRGLFGLLKLARQLYKMYDIDAVADLHNVLRTRVMGFVFRLCGLPVVRLDKERAKRKALINHKSYEPVTPTIDRYRLVFENLGLEAPGGFTRLYDGKPLPVSPIVLGKEPGQRWIAVSPFSARSASRIGPRSAAPRTRSPTTAAASASRSGRSIRRRTDGSLSSTALSPSSTPIRSPPPVAPASFAPPDPLRSGGGDRALRRYS